MKMVLSSEVCLVFRLSQSLKLQGWDGGEEGEGGYHFLCDMSLI